MDKQPIVGAEPAARSLIESEEAAARLARVILSDIELYNQDRIRAHADLTPQLTEGLSLFRTRVIPGLVPLFAKLAGTRPWAKSVRLLVVSPPVDQLRVDTAAFEPTAAAPSTRPGLLEDEDLSTRRWASDRPPATAPTGVDVGHPVPLAGPAAPRALDWKQISRFQVYALVGTIAVAVAIIVYCSIAS
jgi:hypothetical protein